MRLLFPLAAIIVGLSLGVNLQTIAEFPSWFDEAFFANISFNLAEGLGRTLDLIPNYFIGEVNVYGPVYFWLQARLIDWAGLDAQIFRVPNLLSGYLAMLLMAWILYQYHVKRTYALLFLILGLLDVSFNRNLVSGRMDLLALFCVVAALLLVSRPIARSTSRRVLVWGMVGILCALAFLTTPRAVFLLPVVVVIAIRQLYRAGEAVTVNMRLAWLGMAMTAFVVPVFVWVTSVGGLHSYIGFFTGSAAISSHIAPSFFRSTYDNIGISIMLVLLLLQGRRLFDSAFLIGLVLNYLVFSLFVMEIGPYAAMIMPFVLAAIVLMLDRASWRPKLKMTIVAPLLIPGLLLIMLRGIDLSVNDACRDVDAIAVRIDAAIPANRDIIAPMKYYFLLERAQRRVTTFEYASIDPSVMARNADFLILSNRDSSAWLDRGFEPVFEFHCQPRHLPFLPETFYERSTFQEVLLRRVMNGREI